MTNGLPELTKATCCIVLAERGAGYGLDTWDRLDEATAVTPDGKTIIALEAMPWMAVTPVSSRICPEPPHVVPKNARSNLFSGSK